MEVNVCVSFVGGVSRIVRGVKIEETTLVNLTPHAINIFDDNGNKVLEIPPSGIVTRVSSTQVTFKQIADIPVSKTIFTDIVDLPEPTENTVFIVSSLVLQALKARGIKRDDLVAPDTSPNSVIRDENGRIIGVKGFQLF